MIKLLHTADQQLGVKFLGFGEKGRQLRQAVKESLKKTVDLALAESVDLVLIAGDLFDSSTVSRNLVEESVLQLKRLAPIPTCILPGTHDCYDAASVYRRSEFQTLPHIHIFTDEIKAVPFPDLDITVYGRANLSPQGSESPLEGLVRTNETTYHVAMAHGEIAIEGKFSGDYYPMRTKEIAESGMNYVALGHWHRYADFSQGAVKACYPGAPETLSFVNSGTLLTMLNNSICQDDEEQGGVTPPQERRASQRELVTGLKLTQPAVSQALRIMMELYEGIVEADKMA